jgi:hypothetical protein
MLSLIADGLYYTLATWAASWALIIAGGVLVAVVGGTVSVYNRFFGRR